MEAAVIKTQSHTCTCTTKVFFQHFLALCTHFMIFLTYENMTWYMIHDIISNLIDTATRWPIKHAVSNGSRNGLVLLWHQIISWINDDKELTPQYQSNPFDISNDTSYWQHYPACFHQTSPAEPARLLTQPKRKCGNQSNPQKTFNIT